MENSGLTKVLIIDDDISLTAMTKQVLEADGFEVFIANSGLTGVEVAREIEPDVVVLDLMMPDKDGWQVCQAIRAFSQVPILVLSAVIDPGLVTQALEQGADDYLVKPVPVGVLVTHLNKLIRHLGDDK